MLSSRGLGITKVKYKNVWYTMCSFGWSAFVENWCAEFHNKGKIIFVFPAQYKRLKKLKRIKNAR